MPLLSVVVPVYKAEAYLADCVDSLLAQTVTDLEIILVDDGSPDKSGQICDAYAAQHPNVRVIHKQNEGQTATRKAGLRMAQGKYVAFVDSDDWVDQNMFAVLLAQAEEHNADIVAGGFVRDYEDHSQAGQNAYPSGVYRGEALKTLRENAVFYVPEMAEGIVPALWAKVFHREKVGSAILSRNDTIRFGEDALCTNAALVQADCVVIDNTHCAYHYRIWGGSITQAYYQNYFHDLFVLYDELRAIHCDSDSQGAISYNFTNLYMGGLLQTLGRGHKVSLLQKYRQLKALSKDGRLKNCLAYIDQNRLAKRTARYLRLMKAEKPGVLIVCHIVCAAADRANRLIKGRA